ncbi:MAG: aminotransferase class I/II-fold pyridoxal phosphate-dependent enzyme [Acidobacteria bacterium]|nr:aminotransferase class I/II-fold pyridoxal phosphate-dependent enzyme [Acidobacteriota bacterium]MYE42784.1 aminotransferase class I/II-fold pyridoxal phosphate-dependent enzyme [Acidobacteriota bacterium]
MKTTRRSFLSLAPAAAGSAASLHAISARGREAWEAENGFRGGPVFIPPPEADEVRISSNENPLGPGPAAVAALRDAYGSIMRYPMNAQVSGTDLRSKLGEMYGGKAKNVVLSAGSGEILRTAVRVYTGPDRPLVTAECSYESPVRAARYFGADVKALPLTGGLGLDLDKMAGAAIGAGLVFLCNPNNPTGTVHSLADVTDFVNFVKKESPYTAILLDEAYYDYASHPGFDTGAGLAMEHRDVFVARTFSKAFGMAGLRIGYGFGQADTIAKLAPLQLIFGTSVLSIAAAMGSLEDPGYLKKEIKRNEAARKLTHDFFSGHGLDPVPSNTNFIFVNIGRSAKEFREACAERGIMVGRDFPPYEKTHARISIGTLEEMQRATAVFAEVLGLATADNQQQ